MALKPLFSFSTGELDPVMHDKVTLEKFNKGADTVRNVMISKTGNPMSRFSRAHFVKAKNADEKIKLFSPHNSGIVTEWGNLYVRVYDFDANLLANVVTLLNESDLENMHFETTGDYIYVFASPNVSFKFNYSTYAFENAFFVPTTASFITTNTITAAGGPAGYRVDYAIALVYEGEETRYSDLTALGGTYLAPIAAGQSNVIDIDFGVMAAGNIDKFTEVRVYRRPNAGSAFGLLGSTNNFSVPAANLICSFVDLGGNADFTNGVPSIVSDLGGFSLLSGLHYKTGIVYQQRLLVSASEEPEGILASRPGFIDNFYRDFPYDADSALKFKSGSSGNANVLRMVDSDGLIVFTSIGVYVSLGVLNINNLGLEKKGSWVINEKIPPLVVPGGIFFVDKTTNAIMQFIYSDEIGTYQSLEHSIFSNHLFTKRTVTSWTFQDGVNPLIIISFSDGTFALFTYNYEQQMRAWTRHDSEYPIEQVEGTGVADSTFFVTNKDGQRYIEVSLPRKVPADTYEANPESDKLALNYLMDAAKTKSTLVNDSLAGVDTLELALIGAGDWEDNLTLTCGTSGIFTVGSGLGVAGYIFRFFDTTDRTMVDLKVISRTSDDEIVVEPSCLFPSAQASDFRLYETFIVIDDLAHLEGETVSVVVDGGVVGSPNNDVENFTTYTVASGEITLPEKDRGAIIIVGRPITADFKTLNITTVEQKPTQVESLTVSKLDIGVYETRGLYIANKFPEEKTGGKDGSSVIGMEDLDLFYEPDGYSIVGNRYKQPVSKRIPQLLEGEWESNGKIAIRQVDPLHFEIKSIIPDIEVLWRSNV